MLFPWLLVRFNFLDFSEYADTMIGDDTADPSHGGYKADHSGSSSSESSLTNNLSSSDKHLSVPLHLFEKGKGQSPLLESHRTNSESFLAYSRDLHDGGMNYSMSSSHSGRLNLTNGLSAKEFQEHGCGHSRSGSSGSSSTTSSGESNSGVSSSKSAAAAGPLSSSSLPPGGMRRFAAKKEKSSGRTVSYHEAA